MRRFARLFLVLVLVLDAAVVTLMLSGGTPQTFAQEGPGEIAFNPPESAQGIPTRWTREALQLLGRELTIRAEELDLRQLELEELARSVEVLKRAGIDQPPTEDPATTAAAAATPPPAAAGTAPAATARPRVALDGTARQEMFARLSKTYENMEPESAAAALSQLAVLDKGAVVELILGWKPRVAGAVLDALTLSDPALAADLSYGIWLRSGKNQGGTGSNP